MFAVPIYFLSLFFFFFFALAFVLVNDLSLVYSCCFVLEMRTILFLFLLLFVSFCCMHLYFMFTAVSYLVFFHWGSFTGVLSLGFLE